MENDLINYNEKFYNSVWMGGWITSHEIWPIWTTIKKNLDARTKVLEIGPGTRPRIPVNGSYFIELSECAANLLRHRGGNVEAPDGALLEKQDFFDMVCAFEVMEHIPDDSEMLKKINKAMKLNGRLLISVPVNMRHWTELDRIVGHYRRYDPKELQELLELNGFEIERFAEDKIISRIYSVKILQKIAKYFLIRFPKLSAKIETRCLTVMCAFARKFHPIEWKTGDLDELGEETVGLYAVCSLKHKL